MAEAILPEIRSVVAEDRNAECVLVPVERLMAEGIWQSAVCGNLPVPDELWLANANLAGNSLADHAFIGQMNPVGDDEPHLPPEQLKHDRAGTYLRNMMRELLDVVLQRSIAAHDALRDPAIGE